MAEANRRKQELMKRKREAERRRKEREARVLKERIVLLIAMLALVAAFVIVVREHRKAASPVISETQESVQQPVVLQLTEADIHTGDLVLVNFEHPYDFTANSGLDLVSIKERQTVSYPVDKEEFQVASGILPYLDAMIETANTAMQDHETSISSAYRSYDYQQNLWNETLEENGEEYTRKYVSQPGYSEHHTGLAVDLGRTLEDGSPESFTGSEHAAWMEENSWQYGFVRRFQEDKSEITHVNNESWHFRFVGIPHAQYMKEQNLCLEEYITKVRTETSASAPLEVTEENGRSWQIYYTQETTLTEPDKSYSISGDNIDGYIITMEV